VSSIREAVVVLGLERVRELVLMAEVFSQPDTLGLVAQLQRRGVTRGKLARLISAGSPVTHLAGEAALLAEIGTYVLSLRRPDFYAPLWRRAHAGEAPLETLERETFGCTHSEVGAALLGLWGLPRTVANAVNWHHQLPSAAAGLDTRTVLALATGLEDEVTTPGEEHSRELDALALQMGVAERMPAFRSFAAQHFQPEVTS
jgi:HD-like signal output (HDOD) protein